MSNVVVRFQSECLVCGGEIEKVQSRTLKEGKRKSVIYYGLCSKHPSLSLRSFHEGVRNFPERFQESTVSGLRTDNPDLSEPGFVKLVV